MKLTHQALQLHKSEHSVNKLVAPSEFLLGMQAERIDEKMHLLAQNTP